MLDAEAILLPRRRKVKAKVAQLCPTLSNPLDYTVHGILQARNTGVGSLFLLQGIFPAQGSNPGLPYCRQILYQLSHKKAQEYWSGEPIPSPGNLPNPGIKPGSPALQVDSLPAELSGKPTRKKTSPKIKPQRRTDPREFWRRGGRTD